MASRLLAQLSDRVLAEKAGASGRPPPHSEWVWSWILFFPRKGLWPPGHSQTLTRILSSSHFETALLYLALNIHVIKWISKTEKVSDPLETGTRLEYMGSSLPKQHLSDWSLCILLSFSWPHISHLAVQWASFKRKPGGHSGQFLPRGLVVRAWC